MNNLLMYLLQASACFAILYALFYGLLRHLTFHQLNRIILLLLMPLSFALPLIEGLTFLLPAASIEIPQFDGWMGLAELGTADSINPSEEQTAGDKPIPYWAIIYLIGLGIGLLRLVLIIFKIHQLKRQSQTIIAEGYTFILAKVPTIFSCFQWIFVPQEKWGSYPQPVIEHEKVHVLHWHSLDLILVELYIALCWFNPLVYAFRKSIRSIHEFQADQVVVAQQTKKSHYLTLLLHHLEAEQQVNLYSYFNYPILKKRIDMITKSNSTPGKAWRYLLFIPLLSLLSMALHPSDYSEVGITENIKHLTPSNNPFAIFPVKNASQKDITHFYGKSFRHPLKKKNMVHGGIDIRAKMGTPVLVTSDGVVAKASMEHDWGNLIIVTHADGFETWYAHLQGFEIQKGDQVSTGQVIGYVGSTGLSTGPHLHYELRQNGDRVDPMKYYKE